MAADPPAGQGNLGENFRHDLKMFAYRVGNGTLLMRHSSALDEDPDYDYLLAHPSGNLGRLFAIYVNVMEVDPDDPTETLEPPRWTRDPIRRASSWLMSLCDATHVVDPPLADREIQEEEATPGWKGAVIAFARRLGEGRLAPEVLGGSNYLTHLMDGGSLLEGVCAVYADALTVTPTGTPQNAAEAERLAAQTLRQYIDPSIRTDPPLTEAETEPL